MPELPTLMVMVFMVGVLALSVVVRSAFQKTGIDLSKIRAVSRLVHVRVGEYLPGNYGGQPEQLPQVLDALIPMAAEIAVAQGLLLDERTLELIVGTSIVAHRSASRAEVDEALQQLHASKGMALAA